MKSFQQIALIGSTASGKTSLSIKLAKKINANILSIDSLSIYKEIDIASAKPALYEREGIKHYGIDMLNIYENFNAASFIKLYRDVRLSCKAENKNLVIVGGTSFYLKMLIDGISTFPLLSKQTIEQSKQYSVDLHKAYIFLESIDKIHMSNISSSDSYRIKKALNIYFETKLTPTEYFKQNPPKSIIVEELPIYQIVWSRELLRERITTRTKTMMDQGLIDEVCMLEKQYTRKPNCMKSIGIKETLAYLDGHYDKDMLMQKIITNTSRLAKRQATYNNSQFNNITKGSLNMLENELLR